MSWLPTWPPRDWRMLVSLGMLSIAGWGAWLLAKWSLDSLVALCVSLGVIWPLAYYAYGAQMLLAIPSMGFALVVGLKSFKLTGPGNTSAGFEGNGDGPSPTVTTTTATTINNP